MIVEDATANHALRFEGRTICLDATIFLRAGQSIPHIGTDIIVAVGTPGPYLVTGISRPATDEEVERFMLAMHELERELPSGDGDLITFRVIVNTDEDIAEPTLRAGKAIKRLGIDGVVASGVVPGPLATTVWAEAQRDAARAREARQS